MGLLSAYQQLSTDSTALATANAAVTADEAQLSTDQATVATDTTTQTTDQAAFVTALSAAPYNGQALFIDTTQTPPVYTLAMATPGTPPGFSLSPLNVAN